MCVCTTQFLALACAAWTFQLDRPWPPRPTLIDPLRPTSLGFGTSSRSESLDRAAPNDKSRPKRAPETLRDAIFDDFRSIFGSIFEAFQGCIARATRLAARRAEPLFLPTVAALSRVRTLCRKTKNRRTSMKHRSDLTSKGPRNRRYKANLMSKGP